MFGIFKSKAQKEEEKMIAAKKEEEKIAMMAQIIKMFENDEIEFPNNTGFMPKKDEKIVMVLQKVSFFEERTATIRKGMTLGSIHKGKFGAFSMSVARPMDEMKKIDEGTIVITSKRIVFMGTMKTMNKPLNKILSFVALPDGFQVGFEGDKKMKMIRNADITEINGVKTHGLMIEAAVKGQLKD